VPSNRNAEIRRRVKAGEPYKCIAKDYGISVTRVHQIVKAGRGWEFGPEAADWPAERVNDAMGCITGVELATLHMVDAGQQMAGAIRDFIHYLEKWEVIRVTGPRQVEEAIESGKFKALRSQLISHMHALPMANRALALERVGHPTVDSLEYSKAG
jgi:hypothetical protein